MPEVLQVLFHLMTVWSSGTPWAGRNLLAALARFTPVSWGCAFTKLQAGMEEPWVSWKASPCVIVAVWNWQLQQSLSLSGFQPNGPGLRAMKRQLCFEQIFLRTLRLLGPNFTQPWQLSQHQHSSCCPGSVPSCATASGQQKGLMAVTGNRWEFHVIV